MSKILESRKTSNILAKKKEIELSHILSLAYVLFLVQLDYFIAQSIQMLHRVLSTN